MILSETYKNRLKKLSGILKEDTVTLTAGFAGRSDEGTLSWYIEEYLLKLGGNITSRLDSEIQKKGTIKLLLSKSATKIMPNTLVIKFIVEGQQNEKELKEEFLLTLSVNMESSSNTVGAIRFREITNKFNLSSKHSASDLDLFMSEITENILNSIELISKK